MAATAASTGLPNTVIVFNNVTGENVVVMPTKATLGHALRQLTPGGRDWIGQQDARRLFSKLEKDGVMALTDCDGLGLIELGGLQHSLAVPACTSCFKFWSKPRTAFAIGRLPVSDFRRWRSLARSAARLPALAGFADPRKLNLRRSDIRRIARRAPIAGAFLLSGRPNARPACSANRARVV